MRRHMASESAAGAAGPRRPLPGRRLARYALIGLLTVLAVIAGWAVAALVFFAVAAAASTIGLLLAAAVAACLLAAAGGGRLAAKLARLAHPGRYAAGVGLAATALLAGGCSATVLQPLPSAPGGRHQPAAPAGVRYWRGPPGSRLAYLEGPARGPARPDLAGTAVREWVMQAQRDAGTRQDGGLACCSGPSVAAGSAGSGPG